MAAASPFAGQHLLDELPSARRREEERRMRPDDRGGTEWGRRHPRLAETSGPHPTPWHRPRATERGRGDSIILSWVVDFALQSSAFDHGGPIPRRHSCEGQDL